MLVLENRPGVEKLRRRTQRGVGSGEIVDVRLEIYRRVERNGSERACRCLEDKYSHISEKAVGGRNGLFTWVTSDTIWPGGG